MMRGSLKKTPDRPSGQSSEEESDIAGDTRLIEILIFPYFRTKKQLDPPSRPWQSKTGGIGKQAPFLPFTCEKTRRFIDKGLQFMLYCPRTIGV